MPILIDGHNLIGALDDLSLSDPDDELKLVARLEIYARRVGRPVICIFDSGPSPPASQDRRFEGRGIAVRFAPPGQDADTVIRKMLDRAPHPRGFLVISSDREILRRARRLRAETMDARAFARELRRPPPKQSPPSPKEMSPSPKEVEEWLRLFRENGG